jgi:ABC-2 type transport system permease protein
MILSTLIKNELIKIRHSRAFWVTTSIFLLMNTAGFGGEYYSALANINREYALPEAWSSIYGDPNIIGLIFGCCLMILLISSEFSWRTARQNVIDGLTKEQFFLAKALVVVIVAPVFILGQTFIGGLFALLGTDFSQASGPIFGGPQLWFMWSQLVVHLGYGSLVILAATAIRKPGPAVASWFFYVLIGENLIRSIFSRIGEPVRDALHYAPVESFNRLLSYPHHDPATFQAAVDRAIERQRPPPEAINFMLEYGVAFAWIAVIVSIAFISFRRRDL